MRIISRNIIYVNGAYRGEDAIGRLMHDFSTSNADNMYYSNIAEKVRFHKQQSKGVESMCRIFEEYGNERAAEAKNEAKTEFAESLLKDGTMPVEKIAAISGLPLAKVKQIAEKLAVTTA